MFGGEGYGMFEAGFAEELPNITSKNLYDFYKHIINDTKSIFFPRGIFRERLWKC